MVINIANDYSKTPGGRYIKEGQYSGEDFRDSILLPRYIEAKRDGVTLEINLDGCYGFATSFLEESFGGMVRKTGDKGILNNISIISNDDSTLCDLILKYVKDAEEKL